MLNLNHIIGPSNDHLKFKFGFGVDKTRLFLYDSKGWNGQNVPQNKNGFFYRPSDHSLHINEEDPYFNLNILGGYFGRGLFYEHTLVGRDICSRKYPKLLISQNENLVQCFSLWVEDYLSGYLNIHEEFIKKRDDASKEENDLLNHALQYEQKFSEFGVVYRIGLPKKHNSYNLKKIIEKVIFPKKIKLALLYGSKKKYSDLDLFIVSDEVTDIYEGWIDLHSLTQSQVEFSLDNHDIAVSDPIFSGEFILGDKNYHGYLKKKVLNTPISSKSVKYNLRHSEEQRGYANRYWYDPILFKRALKYQQSYSLMAFELNKGNLKLTLNDLLRRK